MGHLCASVGENLPFKMNNYDSSLNSSTPIDYFSVQALAVSQLLSLEFAFNSYRTRALFRSIQCNPQTSFKDTTIKRTEKVDSQQTDGYTASTLNKYISPSLTNLAAKDSHHEKQGNQRFFVEDILSPEFGPTHSANQTHISRSWNSLINHPKNPKCAESNDLSSEVINHNWSTEPTGGANDTTKPIQISVCSSPEARFPSTDSIGSLSGELLARQSSSKLQMNQETALGLNRLQLPAWVFCTRYSDRPSSGPRIRKPRRHSSQEDCNSKRPRTSFTNSQLRRLAKEFEVNRYLDENRRKRLAGELDLRESQVKIWFQNKRAKAKKACGAQDRLAFHLMAEGLYNHSVRIRTDLEEKDDRSSNSGTNVI